MVGGHGSTLCSDVEQGTPMGVGGGVGGGTNAGCYVASVRTGLGHHPFSQGHMSPTTPP